MFGIFKKNKTLLGSLKGNGNNEAGFSLIEMAVVLGIGGVIAGGALVIGDASYEKGKMEITKQRLDKIAIALESHAKTAGYLPCPSEPDAQIASSSFGVITDCMVSATGSIIATGSGNEEIRIGAVPIRALNLPNLYAYDGWNNRISYSVVTELAKDNITYDGYSTTATNNVIQIADKNGNQIPDSSVDIVVAFALVSHGQDGKGAYNKVGSQAVSCNTSQVDGENCNGDESFIDMQITNSEITTKYYDDFILWRAMHTLEDVVVKIR